ncbi:type II toxin-antitoxin system VapC family toxin [Roseitalea porphyridii]|uniref:PIN domain-containing protein n=1 Tax=Roseitalea porphyridii TaxID=1852022 RepID=A0A4P6V2M5_9HYPH|nr:type II toxin-antitoxin system VapC family toxin [Roseitalea porphyridii]QBK30939.1 PIN domain-containing protein [Roseitalea porphyridii]
MNVVADSSAVLAALFDEPGGENVKDRISSLAISAVNLAEIMTRLIDKGYSDQEVRETLDLLRTQTIAFDADQAAEAAALRSVTKKSGLSLGDRACLALGVRSGATVLTADRAWAGLEVGCPIEVIR